jgi:two-component system cell cycle response regulator
MENRIREQLAGFTDQINRLLRGEVPQELPDCAGGLPETGEFCTAVYQLLKALRDAEEFIHALSAGQLEIEPPPHNHLIAPFKQLQANLRHLNWQVQQVAAGDLSQQVDFLGEFADAFNSLIAALREKKQAEEALRQSEKQFRYFSSHDPLTGLYNRGYFSEELHRLERGRNFPVSILVADLDCLKETNDSRGHGAGDQMIQNAARILQEGVRGDDVVARIGGDEFAIILPHTDSEHAAIVLERIRECEAAHNREYPEQALGISLGVATIADRGPLTPVLTLADHRMYEDKAARKETPCRGFQQRNTD